MALFQKKPDVGSSIPIYSVGLETNVLIVGLGNIGKEYEGTRHNIGFAVLDQFADKQEFPDWIIKKDLKCMISILTMGSVRVVLIKPVTLMNLSGEAMQAVQHFYRIDVSKTLIVYDELDIDFGQIRTRIGGSPAGHNGIKSIIQHGGEESGRMRIGIGPKKPEQIDSTDFVLARFTTEETKHLDSLTRETNSILTEYIYGNARLNAETRSFII